MKDIIYIATRNSERRRVYLGEDKREAEKAISREEGLLDHYVFTRTKNGNVFVKLDLISKTFNPKHITHQPNSIHVDDTFVDIISQLKGLK